MARYTHRVALSNDRIVKWDGERVTIKYRDSSECNKTKFLCLGAFEFIRRYLLHVLPDGFMKIRHYGILSNRNRQTKLSRCKQLLGVSQALGGDDVKKLGWQELLYRVTGIDPGICTRCGKGKMVVMGVVSPILYTAPP